jgi:hypothetical protein
LDPERNPRGPRSGATTLETEIDRPLTYGFANSLPPSINISVLWSYAADYFSTLRREEIEYLDAPTVFKDLRDSDEFEKVIWPNQSESGNDMLHISETGQHSNIKVIAHDHKKFRST